MRIGASDQDAAVITRRGVILGAGLAAVTAGVGARLYQLQIVEADAFRTLAEDNRFNYRVIPPPRGLILDRHGEALAVLRDNLRILAVPEQVGDMTALVAEIGRIVPLSDRDKRRIAADVKRNPPFTPILIREDLSWDEFSAINVRAPDLPGVIADVTQVRDYPAGSSFGHVVGYVGAPDDADVARDPLLRQPGFKVGRAGIESAFDDVLRGEAGSMKVEVNARGRVIREIPDPSNRPRPGDAVRLTLDAGLQRFIFDRLKGESAAVTVMDVRNGDLLALASTPGFDPNVFSVAISQEQWRALLNDPLRPLNDKAVGGLFPPGSTFKMIVALAALREGVIAPEETVTCLGKIRFGDREFNCWRPAGHGVTSMRSGIFKSCDVYFYELAQRLTPEAIKAVAQDYGLHQVYDLPFAGEKRGLIPDGAWKRANLGEPWYRGETLNLSIGQGYALATPLQLCVMAARLAAGRKVRPRVVRADGAPTFEPIGDAPEALALVRAAMDDVVNGVGGTAPRARLDDPKVRAAGKTGTAQVRRITKAERDVGVRENEELPWDLRDHALFVAFAPVDDPRYAISVVVEHGGGGARFAAPVAKDVLEEALRRAPAIEAAASEGSAR